MKPPLTIEYEKNFPWFSKLHRRTYHVAISTPTVGLPEVAGFPWAMKNPD